MTIKSRLAAAALAVAAISSTGPALADDVVTRPAQGSVAETMDRLVAAVEGAGATVFARVDHAQGARDTGGSLPDAELLIFGNPKLGTPVMEQDIRAGLALPLRVLVYSDRSGDTVIAHPEIDDMLDDLGVDDDSEAVRNIEAALENLVGQAAGG